MFPNQITDILSFQSTHNEGDQNIENNNQDKIWMEYGGALDGVGALNPSNNRRKGGRGQKSSNNINSVAGSSNTNNINDEQQRKMIHREIERRRRQEMSDLCSSLRSALPFEYIEGKRSTSEHLAEAVNYIKDLEKNVKELGNKREQLKASIKSRSSKDEAGLGGSSNSTPYHGTVVILPSLGGLDTEINVDYDNEGFSLSTALQVIIDEGLGIASYTSAKVEERLVHNIVCEADDVACIDIDGLQQIDLSCLLNE